MAGAFFRSLKSGESVDGNGKDSFKKDDTLSENQGFTRISKENRRNLCIVSLEINRGGDIINYQKTVKEEIA